MVALSIADASSSLRATGRGCEGSRRPSCVSNSPIAFASAVNVDGAGGTGYSRTREVLRPLRNLWIKVVQQHPLGRLLDPSLCSARRSSWRPDWRVGLHPAPDLAISGWLSLGAQERDTAATGA